MTAPTMTAPPATAPPATPPIAAGPNRTGLALRRRRPPTAAPGVVGAGAGDRGSATVWMLLMAPALVFGTGLVVDGGRAITARQEAIGLASEGARAAVDRMDVAGFRDDGAIRAVAPGAAQAAACTWIGQYRPDASCAAVVGSQGQVDVTVTITYRPAILGAVGVGPQVVSATAGARPAIGDTQEVSIP